MKRQLEAIFTAVRRWKDSPNVVYNTIAAVCVLLAFVEVIGFLKGDGIKIAILVGLAMLALLMPRVESLAFTKDGVVAAIRGDIRENANKIEHTKKISSENDEQISQNIAQILVELRELRQLRGPLSAALEGTGLGGEVANLRGDRFELPSVTHTDDPQKSRFGGKEENKGRRLTADVEASSVKSEWCKVALKVSSAASWPPLKGEIHFFLHDTFSPDRYTIPVAKNGEATLVVRAVGAFTVGAIADNGDTLLELDLATSPNVSAPEDWRSR
jgi:hypothetical protein